MYSILDLPHWLWLPAGNHPESSPRHGRHHRHLRIKERLASPVRLPCLPTITAPPTESLSHFLPKYSRLCFEESCRPVSSPHHRIGTLAIPFNPYKWLFQFVLHTQVPFLLLCFFPPKSQQPLLSSAGGWRQRALCCHLNLLVFIWKCWQRCYMLTPAVHQLNHNRSETRVSVHACIETCQQLTGKSWGLSKQDWARISLVNLIRQWKRRAGLNSIGNVPKICFPFGFWWWAGPLSWWWGDGTVGGQN